jgi:putative membrane protein
VTAAVVVSDWRRMHPASPLVRGWQPLVAVLFLGLQDGVQGIRLAVTGGLALVAAVTAGVYFWLAWRVNRYRLDGADLVVESGVLFKRSRRVPLARLQAVDVVQPLLARAIGLGELRLEVAGGKSSDATLAYLDMDTARRVRNDLLTLAAGLRDDVAIEPAPEEAHEAVIATTPLPVLLASILISESGLIVLVVVASVIIAGVVTGQPAVILGAIPPIAFGMGSTLWSQFSKNFGTTVADSPDGLRLRRGLLETRSQTVPPGRVQGVVIEEPLIWRRIGWVKASATVAGYGAGQTSSSTTLLPVAPHDVAHDVVRRVLPGIEWSQVPLGGVPRQARWRAPIEAARLGAGVGDEGAERVLVTRRGRFGQRTDIVPLARMQSVRLRQGPWQRRLGLATVHADLSAGPVKATALHREEHEARELLDQLVAEARIARAAARPDRWMTAPELPSAP